MRSFKILAVLAALILAGAAVPAARAASYQVVVQASNPVRSLSRDQLSKLFLRKVTRWNSGSQAEPVDLDAQSEVREAFSQDVHGKDVAAIKSYWQKMIFSGRATPPPELSSDAEVLAFVRSHPGAIGYVGSATTVGEGLAVVRVED